MTKKTTGEKIFDAFTYLFFAIVCLVMLYPFYNALIISLMNAKEATDAGLKLFPQEITMEAYRKALSSDVLLFGYRNTIVRTVILVFINVFLTFCGAYPLSKKNLPARNMITLFLIVPMFFSGGLIPNFLLVKGLGLYNTFWALVIPGLISAYNILIMRNFIMGIPESLEESALLDGAGFFTIMIRIIMPLSVPILATVALWVSVGTWNEWFNAMIYTQSEKLTVLQVILRRTIIEGHNEVIDSVTGDEGVVVKSVEAATIMISIGPIVAIYPFFQKYFVKGIMIGSLKG